MHKTHVSISSDIKKNASFFWVTSKRLTFSSVVLMNSAPSCPGTSRKEITEHWEWLEHNLLQTLSIFENENDITTFVKGKVQVRSTKRKLDLKWKNK